MTGEPRRVNARREVILAGGAFNSPQLLMLSGIGPAEELRCHGIPVRVDLPGIGRNLQDRYEIGVVNRMTRPWAVLDGARFERGDRLYREWRERRQGMYISNGAAIALARRSVPDQPNPDLFLMALLARFSGYYPGYSREIVEHHDYLTWAILKAHTENRAGSVTLRSADPRDTPEVNFRYFDEGDDTAGDDLRAVVSGIRMARRLSEALNRSERIADEELPGAHLQTDEELAGYVRDNAWGHHASGTCAIGPQGAERRAGVRLHGARHARPACRRCLGVPANSRLLHRQRRVYGRGKSRRRDPERRARKRNGRSRQVRLTGPGGSAGDQIGKISDSGTLVASVTTTRSANRRSPASSTTRS